MGNLERYPNMPSWNRCALSSMKQLNLIRAVPRQILLRGISHRSSKTTAYHITGNLPIYIWTTEFSSSSKLLIAMCGSFLIKVLISSEFHLQAGIHRMPQSQERPKQYHILQYGKEEHNRSCLTVPIDNACVTRYAVEILPDMFVN